MQERKLWLCGPASVPLRAIKMAIRATRQLCCHSVRQKPRGGNNLVHGSSGWEQGGKSLHCITMGRETKISTYIFCTRSRKQSMSLKSSAQLPKCGKEPQEVKAAVKEQPGCTAVKNLPLQPSHVYRWFSVSLYQFKHEF